MSWSEGLGNLARLCRAGNRALQLSLWNEECIASVRCRRALTSLGFLRCTTRATKAGCHCTVEAVSKGYVQAEGSTRSLASVSPIPRKSHKALGRRNAFENQPFGNVCLEARAVGRAFALETRRSDKSALRLKL